MRLHRPRFFELEDQPWYPSVLRRLSLDFLRFGVEKLGLHHHARPLLEAALRATDSRRVVDLCSGSGGPMPALQAELAERGYEVGVTLTDLFPNVDGLQEACKGRGGAIQYVTTPVDARQVPEELTGFRTLFNGFHHFPPKEARRVLSDAMAASAPVAIFELPRRGLVPLLACLSMPLWVLLLTPFIRPFSGSRIFWTYFAPLVPLTCMWDGLVSVARAYTPQELMGLAEASGEAGYTWASGEVRAEGVPGRMTYLLGLPEGSGALSWYL